MSESIESDKTNKNEFRREEMKYKFVIDKRLIGYNQYSNIERRNRYEANNIKQREQAYIIWCIREQLGNIRIDKPVRGKFTWIEENKKRDLDNVCFAKKFILDSLVQSGVLKDDNRKIVTGFIDEFAYSKESKVIVELEEI